MPLVLRDPDKVLAAEAARILGLTPQRVVQLVDVGKLPARRVLGVRVIPRAAVEALAKERARERRRTVARRARQTIGSAAIERQLFAATPR